MARSPSLIPLTGGAYNARSYIADYEICENLFPEINPQETDPTTPITHYPREGKRPLSSPPVIGPGRGVFTLSNGMLYAVVGEAVYFITQNWQWTQIGTIVNLTTPVSISDNGTTGVLVDGTSAGYTINLSTNAFAALVDGTGTFVGSRRVDFSDTYLGFAKPGSNEWYVSNSNAVTFNALAVANKDSTPDPIQTFAFNIRQAWLIGTRHSEVWFLAGTTPFPYQEWPNIFVPYGCAAPYSLIQADIDLFWISSNPQGKTIAVKTNGYQVVAFSTRALEYEWSNYPTVNDVIGSTFQQAGHTFIVFHFPTANKTWAYDLATKQWHRRTYIDNNGNENREKTTFYTPVGADGGYSQTIVGQDWQTGQLYALDPLYYTDDGQPIVCRRTFPHIVKDMHFLTHTSFVADFETGDIEGFGDNIGASSPWSDGFNKGFGPFASGPITMESPVLCMRYSNDGGKTWNNYRQKGLVTTGNYRRMMRFRGLGQARDRVYELMWSYPGHSALQGAYLDVMEHSA